MRQSDVSSRPEFQRRMVELVRGGRRPEELGKMPLSLQAKLLRALESGTFRRVGGTKTLHADVRIVCATNRDLPRMVKTGAFRQDLYYRVGVFRIELPALHTRREDIPLVADALLESIGTGTGDTYGLSPAALAKLMKYPPENMACMCLSCRKSYPSS